MRDQPSGLAGGAFADILLLALKSAFEGVVVSNDNMEEIKQVVTAVERRRK